MYKIKYKGGTGNINTYQNTQQNELTKCIYCKAKIKLKSIPSMSSIPAHSGSSTTLAACDEGGGESSGLSFHWQLDTQIQGR